VTGTVHGPDIVSGSTPRIVPQAGLIRHEPTRPGGLSCDAGCRTANVHDLGYEPPGTPGNLKLASRCPPCDFPGPATGRRLPAPQSGHAATGLDAGSADAVLCVDAIHFASQPDAAYCEIRRILTSGGRAVLTNWEALEWDDQRLPGRLRRVDLGAGLTAAGFEAVEVRDRPGWRASERAMWQEAAALDPGDDPALRSFHDEGVRSLEIFGLVRRVIATASAP
jgi:SAM-dependent methyltransferase